VAEQKHDSSQNLYGHGHAGGSYTSDLILWNNVVQYFYFCAESREWVWIFPLGYEYQYSVQSYKSCAINTQEAIHILR